MGKMYGTHTSHNFRDIMSYLLWWFITTVQLLVLQQQRNTYTTTTLCHALSLLVHVFSTGNIIIELQLLVKLFLANYKGSMYTRIQLRYKELDLLLKVVSSFLAQSMSPQNPLGPF